MRALTLALILFTVVATFAEDPRDAITRGNEHFQAGRYEEALAAYDQAADNNDESLKAELLHNRAAAQFKLGQIAEARELWVRSVPIKDASFEAKSRYNLGNCDYADALAALEAQDANKALELLDVADEQYRQAIRLDRNLTNARANLELTHQLIEQIKENSTTQPQSQPDSQPQDQESTTQPSEDQESQSDQNTEQEDDQDQSSSQPSSQQSEPESQPGEDEQDESDESESDEQEDPTTQPAETQPAATQPSAESQPSQGQQQGSPIELNLTREEAEKLLQKVRDAERARRKILRLREAAKYKPADRDW